MLVWDEEADVRDDRVDVLGQLHLGLKLDIAIGVEIPLLGLRVRREADCVGDERRASSARCDARVNVGVRDRSLGLGVDLDVVLGFNMSTVLDRIRRALIHFFR